MAQVFWIQRERTVAGKSTVEHVYGITSLPRDRADAARLLALARSHWKIENQLHYVRDVTMGEDGCRVRTGSAPYVLASLRNAALALLHQIQPASIPQAIRNCAFRPNRAIRLILQQP